MATANKKSAVKKVAAPTTEVSSKRKYNQKPSSVVATKKDQSLYMQNLKTSEATREEQDLHYHVEDKLAQFQEDVRATNRALAAAKRERVELISSKSLTSQGLSTLDQKIEGLQKGIVRLEGYIAELF